MSELKIPYQKAVLCPTDSMQITLSGRFEPDSLVSDRPFIAFLDGYVHLWNSAYRWSFAWKMKHSQAARTEFKRVITAHTGFKARAVNAIMNDVNGTIKAAVEIKKEQLKSHKNKLKSITEKIAELDDDLTDFRIHQNWHKPERGAVQTLRNLKRKLVSLKNKKNRCKQKIASMEREIRDKVFSCCFGSSDLLKKRWTVDHPNSPYASLEEWKEEWDARRNRRIFYIGSSDEQQGCGLLQLRPSGYDWFSIKLFSPFTKDEPITGRQTYLTASVRIPYKTEELAEALKSKPVCYTLIRKEKGWYIQPSFLIKKNKSCKDRSDMTGCLGLDINAGFITCTDVKKDGTFLKSKDYYYGDLPQEEAVKTIISRVFKKAKLEHYCVAIENISLTGKKSKGIAKTNKGYNRMLSEFPYKRYREICESASVRSGVDLYIVDPAWTSVLGKEKYKDQFNLSVHQAAAYVIGRRALGFNEYKI